jgi:hypothetical protein
MRAVPDRAGPGGTYEAVPNAELYIHMYGWNAHALGWLLIS